MKCSSCGLYLERGKKCPICDSTSGKEAFVNNGEDILLSRWLSVMFWLSIPSVIGSLISEINVPKIEIVGAFALVIVYFGYALALFKLSTVENRYRKALISYILSFAAAFVSLWMPIIALAALGASLLTICFEYKAHEALLHILNPEISESWNRLLKWTIAIYVALIVSMFLSIFIPTVALILISLVLVGLLITSIERMVLLSVTSKVFKQISSAMDKENS